MQGLNNPFLFAEVYIIHCSLYVAITASCVCLSLYLFSYMWKFLHLVVTFLSSCFVRGRNTYYPFILCKHNLFHSRYLITSVFVTLKRAIRKRNVVNFLIIKPTFYHSWNFKPLWNCHLNTPSTSHLGKVTIKVFLIHKISAFLNIRFLNRVLKLYIFSSVFKITSIINLHIKIWDQ